MYRSVSQLFAYTAKPQDINKAVAKFPHLDDVNFTYEMCRFEYYLFNGLTKKLATIPFKTVLNCTYIYHRELVFDKSSIKELDMFNQIMEVVPKFIRFCKKHNVNLPLDKQYILARTINHEFKTNTRSKYMSQLFEKVLGYPVL